MAQIEASARVGPNDLAEIFDTTLSDHVLNAFINAAHRIVEDRLAGSELSEETLTQIELFLAAHLLAARDQRPQTESIGGEYSVSYQGVTGKGLEATYYGQVALGLDTTGKLALAGGGLRPASFIVHGTNAT